ncbi:ArnT family glycosyltransferase [Alienimonas sp. DA493]|uniref:ArnT family glycosyltransferase n=1 Tax=Alienimonas sp. DA493 TaxID=3373605 RepID=UPI003754B1E7
MNRTPDDPPAPDPARTARWKPWAPPLAAAAVVFLVVLCQLDPGGADPGMPQGPGLTVDEGFYTQQGVYLAAARHYGLALLDPRTLGEIFDTDAGYMADHPPLAKLWLGLWHDLAWWVHAPENPGGPFSVARARVGSAAAFALTVGLLILCGTRWYGLPTGLAAGASLVLMPRVFGHAHIASLETATNLFYTACLCGVAAWWNPRVTSFKRPALCGLLFGLALLCKIQGALLGPTVAVWALYHAGREHGWKESWRAIGPVAVFGGVGLCAFFVGWPYLWLNPSEHGAAFLGTITDRLPIRNYYLGQVWNGEGLEPTPWHYPLVMTLATVPVGLTALAVWGAIRGGGRSDEGGGERRAVPDTPPLLPPSSPLTLFTAAVLVPLALVCTRGESLYDGVRLWLVIFPPLALLAGRGAGLMFERLKRWRPKLAAPAVVGLLALQGVNVVWMSPVWLSSYSAAVGGLWGADRLGFERNYWGDAVTRELWRAALRDHENYRPLQHAPRLHQFVDNDLKAAVPALASRWDWLYPDMETLNSSDPFLAPAGIEEAGNVQFVRLAYWNQSRFRRFYPPSGNAGPLFDRAGSFLPDERVVRRQGVVLGLATTSEDPIWEWRPPSRP